MKRWLGDRLWRRMLLLAAIVGVAAGLLSMLTGHRDPWHDAWGVYCGVQIGGAAMRLWTWKEQRETGQEAAK